MISPAGRGKTRFGLRKVPINTENQIYINDMNELDGSAGSGIGSGIAPELAAEFDISLLTCVFLIKRI
jgi:hypothetical protein